MTKNAENYKHYFFKVYCKRYDEFEYDRKRTVNILAQAY